MHFHLPKPLHGWREFVGEIAIIVIGVSIALIAEQIVEAAHWRNVVAEESAALDSEVAEHWRAMTARVGQQSCIDQRLADLALVFARHDAGLPLGLFGPVGRPRVFTAGRSALAIATADQALSHMPLERKQAYFAIYVGYDTFAASAQEERASWRALQALDHSETLASPDWRDLRKAYDDAVDSNVSMKTNLVIGPVEHWLSPFAKFPPQPINRRALEFPSVRELCSPAVAKGPNV